MLKHGSPSNFLNGARHLARVISARPLWLDGMQAFEVEVVSESTHEINVLVFSKDDGYLIGGWTRISAWERDRALLDQVVHSFQLFDRSIYRPLDPPAFADGTTIDVAKRRLSLSSVAVCRLYSESSAGWTETYQGGGTWIVTSGSGLQWRVYEKSGKVEEVDGGSCP
ncbi:MAG: hypothetical protein EXR67_04100 [Dehalococcoidia bacterium]|nr:hypothetical protein [Dehalococcoidia bacterium]